MTKGVGMRAVGGTARRAVVVAVAVLAATLGVAAPADAAEIWWWPTESVPGVLRTEPTHDGRVLTIDTPEGWGNALIRIQSLDGTWGEPRGVLPPGIGGLRQVVPVTTTDATYLVWMADSPTPGDRRIGVARLQGSTWSQLPSFDVDPGVHPAWHAFHLASASRTGGEVTVAWYQQDGTARVSTYTGSAWSTPEALEPHEATYGMSIAVAEDGTRVVGYVRSGVTPEGNTAYVQVDPGDGWGAATPLSGPGIAASLPRLHAAGDDVVAVLTKSWQPSSGHIHSHRYRDGLWSPTTDLGPIAYWAMDGAPGGEVTLVKMQGNHMEETVAITAVTSHPGGWSAPTEVVRLPISRPAYGHQLDVAVGRDGSMAISAGIEIGFRSHKDPHLALIGRRRGGPWTEPVLWEVSDEQGTPPHATPTVVVDSYGYLHLGWWQYAPNYRLAVVVPFSDLEPPAFYTPPAIWAHDVGLSTGVGGTDQFQPNRSITRAEAITALWRLEGSPTGAPDSGFADVAPNAFYTSAVNWARAEGYTTGVAGANVFQPDRTITRAELLTLLWRSAGSPGAPASGFEDVAPGAFYAPAGGWARQLGITTGVGGTNRFEPNRSITRGETFTLIYRFVDAVSAAPSTTAPTARPEALLLEAADRAD